MLFPWHTPNATKAKTEMKAFDILNHDFDGWNKRIPHVLCVDTGRSSETAKAHRG
eukprot:TRINITY_DN16979_c0_g1_i1.p3 TRINITY_DN16979_c0_g1~~TRINITY_DN16979_c0_g1_i1.p3  ORF type:complete len:55 (+),score=11.54 TRINITY_DN16979_c0_g1_i1:371-535(+)